MYKINSATGIKFVLVLIFISSLIAGCKNRQNNAKKESIEVNVDTTSSIVLKFNKSLFSIPSPHQATMFIKKNGVKFNRDLLNKIENLNNYTTSFKKALNLGVFGTNLGYLNAYEQIPESFKYFSAIKKLSEGLGIYNSFNPEVIKSIERNLSNKDSLLFYISRVYQDANNYLNSNQRDGIGVLIITGGWIESLYLLSQSVVISGNYDLRNRLGDQKHPLDNLIDLLSPYYYQSDDYTKLVDKLVDLAYAFDGIIYNYSYEKPVVDTTTKQTIINSESKVVISDYHLNLISQKVSKLRNDIIN